MAKNPFLEDSKVVFQGTISKKRLIKEYKECYNLDINELISSANAIELYKCKKSGYKFFYPFNITGNSKFYEKLQEHEWYYMPWKWEHQICTDLIREGDLILEVGCGKGDFLKVICNQYNNIQCVGLELNESCAISKGKYKIINRKIEDYCIENMDRFDLVCSFQVLEHIPTVNSFLSANIKCLKEDGLLVISVPNNDSFIKYDKSNILNMPPHHMGLWNEDSLKMIGNYFGLELIKVEYEPLQDYHFYYYFIVMTKKIFGRYFGKFILKVIEYINFRKFIITYIKRRANKIHGHTILTVFKKTAAKSNIE